MNVSKAGYGLGMGIGLIFCNRSVEADRIVRVTTFAELKKAVQTALPHDLILISPGVYRIENASRLFISDRPGPVTVKGQTGKPGDVTIEGAGQDDASVSILFNLNNSPHWTFQDFSTRNSYFHAFKFDGGSSDCTLKNLHMRNHGEGGIKGTFDLAGKRFPDRLTVEGCDIGFTQKTGGTRSVVEGIDGVAVNDWKIRDCRFVNIQKGGAPAYGVFTKGSSSGTIIENCRFEGCFIGASFGGGGTDPRFFRNGDRRYEHRGGAIRNNVMLRCTDAGIYLNKANEAAIFGNVLYECGLTIQLRYPQTSAKVRNNRIKPASSNPGEPAVRVRDGAVLLLNENNLVLPDLEFPHYLVRENAGNEKEAPEK